MNVIKVIMAAFSILAALDYITGNHLKIGKEFERGILMTGTLALGMSGMIILAPLIAVVLSPILSVISRFTPFDPSVFVGIFLANDMGGAPLSMQIAESSQMGYFSGLVIASMMGATISFSLPMVLVATGKKQQSSIMTGLMCGICVVPFGCFISGLMVGMDILTLLINMIPLVIISAVLSFGLLKKPNLCIKLASVFAVIIKTVIVLGLSVGITEFLIGRDIVPHTDSLENSFSVVLNATAVMTGAFPLIAVLRRVIHKPLCRVCKKTGINEVSAVGFISSLATNLTTFSMMDEMDDKGLMLNSAFSVSASFCFAGHLAFTMSFNPDFVPAVIVGKLVSGIVAVFVASLVYKKKFSNA